MYLSRYFDENNLENAEIASKYSTRSFRLKDVLRLDYNNTDYRREADASQPNDTPSREKILQENDLLYDGESIKDICVNTVTTRQDRNPNSGVITYDNGIAGKTKWRYLTPRECFMLMGFDEEDFRRVSTCDPDFNVGKKLFTTGKLIKLAGNSICVDVLEAIFRQIMEIDEMLFE